MFLIYMHTYHLPVYAIENAYLEELVDGEDSRGKLQSPLVLESSESVSVGESSTQHDFPVAG